MHSLQACYNQSCFSLNLRTVVHYGQEVKSKKFQAYDHGNENQNYYGQDTPPEYRIDVITAPIATYWGDNDWLADPAVSNLQLETDQNKTSLQPVSKPVEQILWFFQKGFY